MIYFDNNATTRMAPSVSAAMQPFFAEAYGNPSSAYLLGSESRAAVERARASVASLLGAADPSEIAFTSCGTESDNWAIMGALEASPEQRHLITTRVEHEAVRKLCSKLEQTGYRVTWLEVSENGELDLDALAGALDEDTALVSIMLANNETGILFPAEEIASLVKSRSRALFHVDGVNAAGKVPIDLKASGIDLFSISAHKFHGPKGVGALYIRDGIDLRPFLIGGGQENGRRAGTEAVHQAVGMGAAADLVSDLSPMDSVRSLRDRLEQGVLASIPETSVNGTADEAKRLPNTSSLSFRNANGEMILHRLDDLGICVSTGSACNAHDRRASAVLEAMNVPYEWAMGSIRFSLSRFNNADEIDTLLDVLPDIVSELRSLSGATA